MYKMQVYFAVIHIESFICAFFPFFCKFHAVIIPGKMTPFPGCSSAPGYGKTRNGQNQFRVEPI